MKIKNLVGRKFSTLSQSEKEFYWEPMLYPLDILMNITVGL